MTSRWEDIVNLLCVQKTPFEEGWKLELIVESFGWVSSMPTAIVAYEGDSL